MSGSRDRSDVNEGFNKGPEPNGEQLDERQVEELIEEYEGATRRFQGALRWIVWSIAVLMAVFHLWAALAYIPAQQLRAVHLGLGLLLIFLLYPGTGRAKRTRLPVWDAVLAIASVVALGYMVLNFQEVAYRIVRPSDTDLLWGVVALVLVLEASRRTTGIFLPLIALAFIAYAFLGPHLPGLWQHRGYSLSRLVGQLYLSTEGIFGVPLGVSASFIILFTIYGAILDASGAGKFFVDLSLALTGGRRSGAGRAVTIGSFLLGGPSGSGVATAVTLGAVTWPMLRQAGYTPITAGAILSAGGIGAVISPPIMGAASFIIAEILQVSYLEVIRYVLVPTILYYLCILITIEVDSARLGTRRVEIAAPPVGELVRRYGFHLTSLFAIVVFLMMGYTAAYAVIWSMALAVAVSFIRPETALRPRRLLDAFDAGARAVLSVVATTAVAGIIVGVVNLTGLGLKFSSIIIGMAGGNLFLTLVFAAVVLLILGLALPITASYIVAAVIVAPALVQIGVPEVAAHMFIFYYSVLSEVSPPTALACFAVSAITGGNPYRIMWTTWRYALPAFIVPFMFSLNPSGVALLLVGEPLQVILAVGTSVLGVIALATGLGGWLLRPTALWERVALIGGGLLLTYSAAWSDAAGIALLALVIIWQRLRPDLPAPGATSPVR
ncbi:MAG: TRAP transporter fused permease subunit [Firmicutes bacterium]|nr:TRAP transporter fused permease subunit [Bacillota bacterium]